jgi:flagellar biosynthesis/type III secretory pathway M-ring protein FliF/YscJ
LFPVGHLLPRPSLTHQPRPAYLMQFHTATLEEWEYELQESLHLSKWATLLFAGLLLFLYYFAMMYSVIRTFSSGIDSHKRQFGKVSRKQRGKERSAKEEKEKMLALLNPTKHHKALKQYEKSLKRKDKVKGDEREARAKLRAGKLA